MQLKCPDTYDYLPMKIYCMLNALKQLESFNNITHIFKIDDLDVKFNDNINEKLIKIPNIMNINYAGQRLIKNIKDHQVCRTWRFNKCPPTSKWYNKEYDGEYVPWIDGGCGYILSKISIHLIANEDESYIQNHIYEDLMVAILLKKYNIIPIGIKQLFRGSRPATQ